MTAASETRQTFTGGSSYVDYYYDNISQLTNADSSINAEDRGYFYDAAWNLHPVRYSSVGWRLESHLPERESAGRGSAAELSHGVKQPTGMWTNGFGFDSPREIFCSVTAGGISVSRFRIDVRPGESAISRGKFARPTNVISPAGTSWYQYRDVTLASGDHTACDLVARLNLPNTAYITNNQDDLGRLLSTILKTSGDVILNSHEYTYNDGSQRTHQTFNGGSYVDYFYDNISQLTNADSSINSEDRGYLYDSAWNSVIVPTTAWPPVSAWTIRTNWST